MRDSAHCFNVRDQGNCSPYDCRTAVDWLRAAVTKLYKTHCVAVLYLRSTGHRDVQYTVSQKVITLIVNNFK